MVLWLLGLMLLLAGCDHDTTENITVFPTIGGEEESVPPPPVNCPPHGEKAQGHGPCD